jgi:cell division protein FtsW
MRKNRLFDMPLFVCVLILVGLGVVYVYSASFPRTLITTDVNADTFAYAKRQLIAVVIGLAAMFGLMLAPLSLWERYRNFIIGGTAALMCVPLAFQKVCGNAAWIPIGAFKLQPSEFSKVALIIILGAYLAKHPWTVRTWKGLLLGPGPFIGGLLALIMLQRDLGTAVGVVLGCVGILAIAGTKFRIWGLALLGMFLLAGFLVWHSDKQPRLVAWLHPFDLKIEQGMQPRHALIAIGSGGLTGMGFCQSQQKYGYLPGSHNDYIFAIIAEELGFGGTVLFLLLPYLFLIYRGFTIAHQAPDEFSALVAAGATAMLASQAVLNMAVAMNLMPSMGINLPFISYGGSSLIASLMMAGLLLNVSMRATERDPRQAEQPAYG